MSWKGNADLPHVGWKAHLASTPEDALRMAEFVSAELRFHEISHKVDIDDQVFNGTKKFITIYVKNEDHFGKIVPWLERILAKQKLGHKVSIEGDMAVGKKGLVHMRHGQNTPLTLDLLETDFTFGPEQNWGGGKIVECTDYDTSQSGGMKLYYNKKMKFFHFLDEENKPVMAILVNGKVVPDYRDQPNPANVPLPSGVRAYVEDEWFDDEFFVGGPPKDKSPLMEAIENELVL